ncbi:glycine cleavage system protein [Fragilaria crotonensis]|nr:glycine cleavage system protein [Fragilaria crotonensis]
MLARSALLRRLSQRAAALRSFHASVLANDALDMADTFARRHMGPSHDEAKKMLATIGFESFDDLVKSTVPGDILTKKELKLEPPRSESEALAKIRNMRIRIKS